MPLVRLRSILRFSVSLLFILFVSIISAVSVTLASPLASDSLTVEYDITENVEPFYVFPANGFKFLYSKEVDNSTENYKQVFESILDTVGEASGKDIFTDLLRFTYISENLANGIESGAEIIIYGIPYYYAIRESQIDNYDELLTAFI